MRSTPLAFARGQDQDFAKLRPLDPKEGSGKT
jgi:hypothetical protein